ncbi:XRE family transcriptional regulator [Sphingobacterium sp. DK4209]|uniref:XRE family transcriptional regulator n=1 Tax=Sphingobacterium zhuxiongii TaxID=2662364 RepID=A0A5Q0QIA7_9SPHI|nr:MULTISPECIES: helix-turn-helix transcriptional regulator [unclassified Sphingobacterium]MVZ65739.1 XRE family transcriptional regulator [Sphingobacterium sp. DK4209]QGA27938.1 XRE family transcriptional regulator [Sphingobacterium sp. dk4302]
MKNIFEITTNRVEFELILNIKVLREQKGWSQRTLSRMMGLNETFVGKCESFNQPEKYNLRHLITLSKIFNLERLDDFYSNGIPKDEQIKVIYRKLAKIKKDGTESKTLEDTVVEIVPIVGVSKKNK